MKFLVCALVFCSVLTNIAIADERKHVLVISAYHPAFPTFLRQLRGVKQGFLEEGFDQKNMDLDYEFMDSKRFYTEVNLNNFAKSLTYKVDHLKQRYDVVLVADDNALDFSLAYHDRLFEGIPIVFFGINNVEKALSQNANSLVTGVVEAISIKDTFDIVLDNHGEGSLLQILVDESKSGQANLITVKAYLSKFTRFQLEWLDLSLHTYQDIAERLNTNNNGSVLLLSGYRDVAGDSKDFFQFVDFVSNNSSSPVYHFWRHGVGDGLFGGKVVSHFEQGRIAANLAGNILNGKSSSEFPVVGSSPNVYMVDYQQLDEFGFSENEFPDDVVWVNKPLSFRETNPELFWLGIAGYFVFMFVIIGLLYFIHVRKKLTVKLEASYHQKSAELEHAFDGLVQSEKMAALGRLVSGVAHEINTPVGVGVTTTSHIQALIEQLSEAFDSGQLSKKQLETFLEDFREGVSILMSSLSGASKLISSFKQVAVDQSDEQCRDIIVDEYIKGIAFSLKPELKLKDVDVDVVCDTFVSVNTYPGALSQIVTNLIINSLIHGFEHKTEEVGRITINIVQKDGVVELHYQDNGCGMPAENVHKAFDPFFTTKMGAGGSGLGLNIVYNLVTNKLKGNIECRNKVGEGVEFIFTLKNLLKEESEFPSLTG